MNQFRWGGKTRQDSQDVGRDRILAAARICFEKLGVEATNLEDIAREAQISRRTVYRYFKNLENIIQTVVEEQGLVFLAQMQVELGQHKEPFAEMLKHYMMYLVKYGPEAPGHQLILKKTHVAKVSHYYFSSKALYDFLALLTQQPFEAAQQCGEIRADIEFKPLMEYVGRMVFSFIQFPVEEKHMKTQIEHFLLAALK